jgi:hypothetical protein
MTTTTPPTSTTPFRFGEILLAKLDERNHIIR